MKQSLLCLVFCFLAAFGVKSYAAADEGLVVPVGPKECPHLEEPKRPESPKIKSITTYKITPEDEKGFILNQSNFNAEGLRTEFISYDYYGSGEVDGKTTYTHNSKGELIEMYDGNTTTKYEYDANGRKIKDAWSRPGGKGASESISYDDKGNNESSKYFKLDGTLDYSRVYEREYDDNDNIKWEKKWEKYTDGTNDLLQYHVSFEYNKANELIKKMYMREDGNVYRREEMKYDEAGNLIETATFEDGASKPGSKDINEYNEFREVIKNQVFNCDANGNCNSLQYTNTFTYDEYGHMIHMMYKAADGDAWGERVEYEYH